MTKNQGLVLEIALMLLFTSIALATSTTASATSDVIIYAFDQNPAGSDDGNEWVTFHNPSNESVDIGNWTFESTHGTTAIDWIAEGTNRYWMRNNSGWTFGVKELEKGELWSGYVKNVVDGDTVDVCFNIYGVQRVRLAGINTPEIGEDGYEEAKAFVNKTCWGEEVKLDVDDREQYDPHYRILAVVYVNDTNLNEKLVKEGYAEVMYIPPSEFDSREWEADYIPSSSPISTTTPIPGFELLLAIIGVLAAMCLVRQKG
jgi:micrococcal nuclease